MSRKGMKNNNIPGFERENKKHHQDQHKRVLMQLKKSLKNSLILLNLVTRTGRFIFSAQI